MNTVMKAWTCCPIRSGVYKWSRPAAISSSGFSDVTEIQESTAFRGITIHRTGGRHGTGEIGITMGQVLGFVLQEAEEPTLYVVGDPITMDEDDVVTVCRYAPGTRVVAVHMDTINHCHATRDVLRSRLAAEGLLDQVTIPKDGEWV